MAITKQNITDRAAEIASNTSGKKIAISEPLCELLLPHVIQNVCEKGNLKTDELRALRQTYELSFVDNEAIVPDLAFPEYLDSAELYDEDRERLFSPAPTAWDMNSTNLPSICDYWLVQNDTIRVKLQDTETFSGLLLFDCVSQPEIPASPTEVMDIPPQMADDIVIELARAVLSQPPYQNLGAEIKN